MADRVGNFSRQKVTEASIDVSFELLDKADNNVAADIGV